MLLYQVLITLLNGYFKYLLRLLVIIFNIAAGKSASNKLIYTFLICGKQQFILKNTLKLFKILTFKPNKITFNSCHES